MHLKLLIIDGPNMNLLGIREKNIYGDGTYDELSQLILRHCEQNQVAVELFQSNHEGAIIDRIQQAFGSVDGIVINPAAYTHTSIAIADALKAVAIPYVEVHISNISSREEYRKISYVSAAALATVSGCGFDGYIKAINILLLKGI